MWGSFIVCYYFALCEEGPLKVEEADLCEIGSRFL